MASHMDRHSAGSKELIGSNDTEHSSQLHGAEILESGQISKKYHIPEKTIMDETLGNIISNTLDFVTYSGDNYMKKVYEAEEILKKRTDRDGPVKPHQKYMMGFSLFCIHDTNAIYLGILLIFVSLIIYFMSIVTTNDTQSRDP